MIGCPPGNLISKAFAFHHGFQMALRLSASLVGSESFRRKVARAAYLRAMDRTDAGWLLQCISGRRDPNNFCTLDKMWPLPNVWLGVSAEDQQRADERIPLLLPTPAAVRFVSVEPMLGPVDLSCLQHDREFEVDALTGAHGVLRPLRGKGPSLDWVIAGCESGHGARPADVSWFRSLKDQCVAAGTPYFLKQMMVPQCGGKPKLSKMPELDGRVWDQVPSEVQL